MESSSFLIIPIPVQVRQTDQGKSSQKNKLAFLNVEALDWQGAKAQEYQVSKLGN